MMKKKFCNGHIALVFKNSLLNYFSNYHTPKLLQYEIKSKTHFNNIFLINYLTQHKILTPFKHKKAQKASASPELFTHGTPKVCRRFSHCKDTQKLFI